jgi:hypothetical protein
MLMNTALFAVIHVLYNIRHLNHFLLQKWMEIIGQARQNADFLKDQDVIRTVLNVLQV